MKSQLKAEKRNKKKDDESEDNEDQHQAEEEGSEDQQQSEDEDQDKKWDYLEHKGVTFFGPYIPNGTLVSYQGEKITLLPQQQQLIMYWHGALNSAQATNPIFKGNFQKQFMKRFKDKKFDLFDFSPLYEYFENAKKQKNTNEELKIQTKAKKLQEQRMYGFCLVDNLLQKLGAFKIEAPTLLRGRGQHPKAGLLKARILPEDVTINIAENAPIPICSMKGHCWGDIVHKHQVTWLASYKDIGIKKSNKYVYLAANSVFKYSNDMKKYQKARKLQNCIEDIRKDYRGKLESNDVKNKQLGTATYLIDTLALRVGNQKSKDQEADTVGCCSLRVQHVFLEGDDKITLKFLGKDSIQYNNTVKVDPVVYKNIQSFLKGKDSYTDIFDKIDAQILNDYLRGLMEGLTAKVFRTYNASSTLQKQLSKRNLTGLTMEQKKDQYDEANTQVAILCNHQKTVSKKSEESFKKVETDLKTKQSYVQELKAHVQEIKNKKKPTRTSKVVKLQNGKQYKMQFPTDKDQAKLLLDKEMTKLQKQQKIFKKREANKQIATGTSKTNYNDPRISVAWCKKNQVKIQKVFNKALLSKFFWAMSTESKWQF